LRFPNPIYGPVEPSSQVRNPEPGSPRETLMLGSAGFSLKARVARSIFWLAWSRGVLQLLSFATTILVARILVPADYGVMALASVFTGIAAMLTEMGLGRAIVQFRDLDRRELDTCFWIIMTLAMIAFAVLSLGASIIARWFGVPRLAEVLPVLVMVLPLTACSIVSDSLLRKRLALDRISQAEIIGGVVALPVTLGCALSGLGVWALVVGSLASFAARSVATFAFAPWFPGLRVGGGRAREVLDFSLTTLGVDLLWALREHADVLVIGKITGQVSVGLYSMAKDLALLPTNKISTAVNLLSSPMMAELQTDVDRMRAMFYRAVRVTAAIAIPTSVGMALVADDIVAVLLGAKWLPSVPILRLLSLYAAVRSFDVLLAPVLFARRRQRFLFWYCLALLVVVPAVTALGAVWDGAAGAVEFFTPVYCGLMAILTKEALAELKGSFLELWSKTWPILAATAAMALFVFLLREFALGAVPEPPLVELVLLSVSGAATYAAALFTVGRSVIGEGTQVVGWILRRQAAD
jgi:O-antigen/teichoic acid export membrane protein